MRTLAADDISAAATQILFGLGTPPMPVPPSDLAVHPYEFMSDDERHDYNLIETCPPDLPEMSKDERLSWAKEVCFNAKTRVLREYGPGRLIGDILGEEQV